MKKFLHSFSIVSAAFALSVQYAGAANITVDTHTNGIGNGDARFVSSVGSDLDVGSLVRVGFFEFGDSPSIAQEAVLIGSDFGAIDALFTPLGSENAAAGSGDGTISVVASTGFPFNQSRGVNGSLTGVDTSAVPSGQQLWLWVFNASDTNSADEWALFTSDNSLWDFTSLGGASLTSDNITVSYSTAGKVDGVMTDGSGNLRLAPIPEPSVTVFGLVALMAVGLRRRR